jgi:hypothetical protein
MVRLLGNSIPESRRKSAITKLMKAFQGQEGWSASSAFATEELRHPDAVSAYRKKKWREEMGDLLEGGRREDALAATTAAPPAAKEAHPRRKTTAHGPPRAGGHPA